MATQDPNYDRDPLDPNYPRRPARPRDEGNRAGGWGSALAAIIVVLLFAMVAAWFWQRGDGESVSLGDSARPYDAGPGRTSARDLEMDTDGAIPAAATQQPIASLANLTQNPAQYYGQSVTIQGVVRETLNNNAFTIATGATEGPEVLVVAKDSPGEAATKGKNVRVSGTFNAYEKGQIQQTLGEQFDESRFSGHQDKPMITATSVRTIGDLTP